MYDLFKKTRDAVKAYRDFLEQNGVSEIEKWEDIPVCDKHNYLLKYPVEDLTKEDVSNAFLIGTSSGFSKSGSVFWLKESVDEAAYLKAVRDLLIDNYGIDENKTLIIVSLAFGTWIGGMQLASTFRNLASEMEGVTVATPGLNIKEAVEIAKKFGKFYDKIVWTVNPSSINIIYYLLKDEPSLLNGKIVFPVVGEYFTENFREDVAVKFGHLKEYPFAVRTGYGSADAGDLGIEYKETIELRKFLNQNPQLCRKLFSYDEAPMMFVKNNKTFIEIINGEIIVTKDQFIPLVRYNTKDCGGILHKKELKEYIDRELYEKLPDEILYVFGRTGDSIIFYGTNLNITRIGDFLSSLNRSDYAGLFEVSEKIKNGVSFFEFVIYTHDGKKENESEYLENIVTFLKNSSNEFAAKYEKLSHAAGEDLIRVSVKSIGELKIDKKHRYIKDSDV
jgi:phenylacetate-CoA ligase